MLDSLFESIFTNGEISATNFFIMISVAIAAGVVFALMCGIKACSSKSFYITTAFIPATVSMVIALVNENIGTGVAVAGAFSLVRFRSAPGTAREIGVIFAATAAGLAFGMGYLAYGLIFIVIAGVAFMAFTSLKIWENKPAENEKILCITISEGLDYGSVFDDIMDKFTYKRELVKVKTINFGSMFRLYYSVTLKDVKTEKQFIDELRIRNGNLEISVSRADSDKSEL